MDEPRARAAAAPASPWLPRVRRVLRLATGVGAVLAAGVVGWGPTLGGTAGAADLVHVEAASAPVFTVTPSAPVFTVTPSRTGSAPAYARGRGEATSPLATARRSSAGRMEVIGHRGGLVWGPESTLATFRHAIEAGADAIEFDIRFTRDGVPVVLHDDTLDRTTNCSGPVARMRLAALKHCDAGTWYRPSPMPGERVPTLGEALSVIRQSDADLYVHVKLGSAGQARAIVDAVRDQGMNDGRATFVSDWPDVLSNLRRAGAYRLGYAFHTPDGWSANYPVLVPQEIDLTKADVARAHRRGVFVAAVQDHPVSARQAEGLDLDGYMANDLDGVLKRMDRLEHADADHAEPGQGSGDHGGDGTDGTDGGNWDPSSDGWDPNDGSWGDDGDPPGPPGQWVVGP